MLALISVHAAAIFVQDNEGQGEMVQNSLTSCQRVDQLSLRPRQQHVIGRLQHHCAHTHTFQLHATHTVFCYRVVTFELCLTNMSRKDSGLLETESLQTSLWDSL